MHKGNTMKRIIGPGVIISMAAIMLFASGANANGGHTAARLENAGLTCIPAGPHDWIHCADFDGIGNGKPAVSVKVFSVDGLTFYGTEQLLRGDLYAGQSCPQDELDTWSDLGDTGYVACHHFFTGHH